MSFWVFFHLPTRQFLYKSFLIKILEKPKRIILLLIVPIALSYFFEAFPVTIGLEMCIFFIILVSDTYFTKKMRRNLKMVLQVAHGFQHALNSGFDITASCRQLSYSQNKSLAELGALLNHAFELGIKDASVIKHHPVWSRNKDLQRFIEILIALMNSGGNLLPWIKRHVTYLNQKVRFRNMLTVKTAQIHLQSYILIFVSWCMFGITMLLFPQARQGIQTIPVCQHFIVIGLTLQLIGIAVIKKYLHKSVEIRS